MLMAYLQEARIQHAIDRAKWQDQMSDFYREKRREEWRMMLHNLFGRTVRRRGRYSAAGNKKGTPGIGQMHKGVR